MLIAALFIAASAYTVLLRLTLEVDAEKAPCTEGLLATLAPWSAGCFYHAYYSQEEVSRETLEFEKRMLDRFVKKGGVATDILWYRFKFHQKYQALFQVNFQELHLIHQDYTKSEHIKLENQAEYWHFLHVNGLASLAQQTLNEYCDTYVPGHRDDLVDEISWRLERRSVGLNLDYCRTITAS